MQLNKSLKIEIEKQLETHTGENIQIKSVNPVHGGDTHPAFQLDTNKDRFFLKTAENIPADLFEKEFKGLDLLGRQKAVNVARPLCFGTTAEQHFLVIEYIPKKSAGDDFWDLFAKGLSQLHQCTNPTFGLQEDNYIGPLPQTNKPYDNWPDFYVAQRLQPLIRKCIDKKLLEQHYEDRAMRLYKRLAEVFPEEPPALLHGDLWGGNYRCGPGGQPYVFDPAVYYGHREIDLAMTRLFGGFDRRFYWRYEEYFPLAPDWQKRIPLCQLYPLLVHSLLFGGGYVQQVRRILEEYA